MKGEHPNTETSTFFDEQQILNTTLCAVAMYSTCTWALLGFWPWEDPEWAAKCCNKCMNFRYLYMTVPVCCIHFYFFLLKGILLFSLSTISKRFYFPTIWPYDLFPHWLESATIMNILPCTLPTPLRPLVLQQGPAGFLFTTFVFNPGLVNLVNNRTISSYKGANPFCFKRSLSKAFPPSGTHVAKQTPETFNESDEEATSWQLDS